MPTLPGTDTASQQETGSQEMGGEVFDFVPSELLVLAGVVLVVGLVAAFLWDRRRGSDDDEDR